MTEETTPKRPCAGCKKQNADLEAKLDQLISDLTPLITAAKGFLNSPAGKLQQALMGRKHGRG
jgi:hypothetical protein